MQCGSTLARQRQSGNLRQRAGRARQAGELEVYFAATPCLTCVSCFRWGHTLVCKQNRLQPFDVGNSSICANIFAPQVFPQAHMHAERVCCCTSSGLRGAHKPPLVPPSAANYKRRRLTAAPPSLVKIQRAATRSRSKGWRCRI